MLKMYFKTAWRNLFNNKFYSIINVTGLTVGLTIGIMILMWVKDELSFDKFHKQASNIYRLELFGGTGSSRQIWTVGPAPIAPLAKQQLPQVKDAVRIARNNFYSLYKYEDKVFGNENAGFADPSFFSVFSFKWIKGNAAKPFPDDNSVVITQKIAGKYFGKQNAIGKTIIADDKVNFTVSGVIADFPKNSSINYDMIMPMSYHIKAMREINNINLDDNFSYFNFDTYLMLKPGASLAGLAAKIRAIHLNHKPEDTDAEYLLLPLTKMHLYNADMTDKGMQTVTIFIIIAVLILVIACINYINLTTARAMQRSKDISMRKIIGASRVQLFIQFIAETVLLFALATIAALFAVYVLMPLFNTISAKQMVFNLYDPQLWLLIGLVITGTLIASSIYPALLLSSFKPLQALKGKISMGISDAAFRKVLVVTQFAFSVILIMGTIVITNQLNYIKSKSLGYDKNHVFAFWMRDIGNHYDAVKAELLKQPGVLNVTRSNQNIINIGGFTGNTDWDGKQPGQTFIVHPIIIDKNFMSFFKMKLLQGRSFTGSAADSSHYILNEAAIKELGLTDPVGKRFKMGDINGTIIGVVKNFHYTSMKEKIAPSVFWYNPNNYGTIYIKTTGKNAVQAIAAAQEQFKRYNGLYPFSYAFLDEVFNSMYQSEEREGTLFRYFALVAIFISCLGLLGLATYTAQTRTKEIGIRKVMGASVSIIVGMLSKDFIKLVIIAIVIATPLAWFVMQKWLQNYAYRQDIQWWVMIMAAAISLFIAFATISFQSIKAALANPVKSLRSE